MPAFTAHTAACADVVTNRSRARLDRNSSAKAATRDSHSGEHECPGHRPGLVYPSPGQGGNHGPPPSPRPAGVRVPAPLGETVTVICSVPRGGGKPRRGVRARRGPAPLCPRSGATGGAGRPGDWSGLRAEGPMPCRAGPTHRHDPVTATDEAPAAPDGNRHVRDEASTRCSKTPSGNRTPMWPLTRASAPEHQRPDTAHRKTTGHGTMKHMVEVLAAYSHFAQAADLRLSHTVGLTSPVQDRARSVRESARAPR